jgi:hypothetical protein
MANRAYLIGGHDAAPIGPATDYDPDQQVLCAASYQIPAFWLFCFNESDLCEIIADDERIPTALTSTATARKRLMVRAPLAMELFAAHSRRWDEWVRLIDTCEFPYLTLDGYEIWAMEPDEFARHLPQAVRWFSSRSPSDRESLFWLAGIEQYDPSKRAIICGSNDSPGRYLQGYGWERDVPWDENDPT